MVPKKKIAILFFHPLSHKSRVNRVLINSVMDLEDVTLKHMYDLYPDFHIDVKTEQQDLLGHDVIIWQHPFYWYSSPSLLKEWIDLVLEHGFAYGREGHALDGKEVMTAISTGGRDEAYVPDGKKRHSIRQLLSPFEQTVHMCRMNYLPPFVVHGTHLLDKNEIQKAGADYRRVIQMLQEGLPEENDIFRKEYMNHIIT
jgi:glutathione-regulated potassium-efflux system ancillary protein KefG